MHPSLTTLLLLTSCAAVQGGRDPVPVIFDTDMDSDCDDALALSMLHALADLGEAEIVATTVSTRNPDSPRCVDAINTFYRRPDLPIGVPKGTGASKPSRYARRIAERFPNDVADPPDAARLIRKLLQGRPDGSVVLLTVGYLTNVAGLLRLPAEDGMESGRKVAKRKVRLWVCMGGNFVGRPAKDDLKLGNNNFTVDAKSAHFAVRNWPGRVMFVGREIGSVPSGLRAGARLKELPESNPVRAAYALYFKGEPKDRHVADPTAVLCAVRGADAYWDAVTTGRMDLHPDMTFEWREGGDPGHGYLVKRKPADDRKIEGAINALMLRPPGGP